MIDIGMEISRSQPARGSSSNSSRPKLMVFDDCEQQTPDFFFNGKFENHQPYSNVFILSTNNFAFNSSLTAGFCACAYKPSKSLQKDFNTKD